MPRSITVENRNIPRIAASFADQRRLAGILHADLDRTLGFSDADREVRGDGQAPPSHVDDLQGEDAVLHATQLSRFRNARGIYSGLPCFARMYSAPFGSGAASVQER